MSGNNALARPMAENIDIRYGRMVKGLLRDGNIEGAVQSGYKAAQRLIAACS
jgi:hypothetical protein